jgi:hypothetical protein
MKIYTIDKLVDGFKIKPEFRGKVLVCCRNDRGYKYIQHDNKIMALPKEPLCTISFADKFKRGETYFLSYYEWKPVANTGLWDLKKG